MEDSFNIVLASLEDEAILQQSRWHLSNYPTLGIFINLIKYFR